jgi:hypothetical protein
VNPLHKFQGPNRSNAEIIIEIAKRAGAVLALQSADEAIRMAAHSCRSSGGRRQVTDPKHPHWNLILAQPGNTGASWAKALPSQNIAEGNDDPARVGATA